MITKVGHKITTAGLDTEIEAVMIMDMSKYWTTSGRSLSPGLEDYMKLFKITAMPELDEETQELLFKAFAKDETEIKFDELNQYNALKTEIETIVNATLEENYNNRRTQVVLNDKFTALTTAKDLLQDFFNIIERPTEVENLQKEFDTIKKRLNGDLENVPKSVETAQDIPQAGRNPYTQTPTVGGPQQE